MWSCALQKTGVWHTRNAAGSPATHERQNFCSRCGRRDFATVDVLNDNCVELMTAGAAALLCSQPTYNLHRAISTAASPLLTQTPDPHVVRTTALHRQWPEHLCPTNTGRSRAWPVSRPIQSSTSPVPAIRASAAAALASPGTRSAASAAASRAALVPPSRCFAASPARQVRHGFGVLQPCF